MKDEPFVKYLSYLQVSIQNTDDCRLMMIEVNGFSDGKCHGIPSLKYKPDTNEEKFSGILAFDFIIKPVEMHIDEKHYEWQLKRVYDLDQFPDKVRAVKVCAEQNADIAVL